MADGAIDTLGQALWSARRRGELLGRDRFSVVPDRASAYAVQAAAADAAGLKRAGWKIAATSPIAQQLIGVDGPSLGPVFADHLHASPATLTAETSHGAAVECEIAFEMAEGHDGRDLGRRSVLGCVRRALIAVEVVGCRAEGGFKGAGQAVLISDFSFNAALVTGAEIDEWPDLDLAQVLASTWVNGEKKAEGTGAAVMGDPADALCWAAGEAARIGRPLMAGDMISTGTMTGVVAVQPGDTAVGDFGPLGRIEIKF